MKIVGTYTGIVKHLATPPDLSIASLTEESTGNSLGEVTAVTEKLLEQNLKEGDKFKVTIYQSLNGDVVGELEKI